MLCLGRGIESHDEVVAGMVCRLQLLRGFGKEVGPPIRYAADNAPLVEHDLAGGFGNSAVRMLDVGGLRMPKGEGGITL